MTQVVRIATNIPILVFQEGKRVVAYSPAIDLSTCGNTEKQARKRFAEAAELFFEEIIQMGTVDDVLTECGWRKSGRKPVWTPPTFACFEEHVQIPAGVY